MTAIYAPCPECGIDHPAGTRHRVSFAQARERDRKRRREYRAGVRVGRGQRADGVVIENAPLKATVGHWALEQRYRGVPADADAVAYALLLHQDPCSYCGGREAVGIDHITTVSRGGRTVVDNLTSACRSCNSVKRSRSLLAGFARIMHRQIEKAGGSPMNVTQPAPVQPAPSPSALTCAHCGHRGADVGEYVNHGDGGSLMTLCRSTADCRARQGVR